MLTFTRTFKAIVAVSLIILPMQMLAEEQRRYKTPSERREAGVKHEITDWMEASILLEYETSRLELEPDNAVDYTLREREKSVQLEVEMQPAEWITAELSYEYDDFLNEFELDEALIEFEIDDYKLELGRLEIPFGEYYSRFITGPLLEFAETKGRVLVIAYEPDDSFEASVFLLKSKLDEFTGSVNSDDDSYDWGLSINSQPMEGVLMGISYLSDLSESDEQLIEGESSYIQQVDALSAYLSIEFEDIDFSLELVQALQQFNELDKTQDQPRAWNFEMGFYPHGQLEYAFRLESSRELEEAPLYQYGLATTWHAGKSLSATFEVLRGRFKKAFVEDDAEQELAYQTQIGAMLIVSF